MQRGIGLRRETPRRAPRLLRVTERVPLGPRLVRVHLGGDLDGFPEDSVGSHIKLFFKRPGQTSLQLPWIDPGRGIVWPEQALRPIARTYTVAAYDAAVARLSVDFALHGDDGPATSWASRAQCGDELGVAGPGGPNPMLGPADRYLLVGDLTALPAIAGLLAIMPAETRGHALIEAIAPEDMLALRHPAGVRVRWFFRAPYAASALPGAVRELSPPAAGTFAFVAGENSAVVTIRDHLLRDRGFRKSQLYATPYWREQQTEEEYHAERHRIMDELAEEAPSLGASP